MSRPDHLFSRTDWHSVDQHQRAQLVSEVNSLDGDQLLNMSVVDLCRYLEEKYRIEVPALCKEGITVDQRETSIDVSQDQNRYISDRSRPFHIAGTLVEVRVPFEGEPDAFHIRPTTYTLNSPRAVVQGQELILNIVGVDLSSEGVRSEIDGILAGIESHLQTLRTDVERLNSQLSGVADSAISRRRAKLLEDRSLVASLGFKMKERVDAPRTYAAAEVRRKVSPSLPSTSRTPFKPEPSMTDADYEHILGVLQNMVHVMERSPSAFNAMDEETLRSHFLVQLNGHYEGQATGETFNYEGKTDILVRSEGRNVFIAECKFWGGPRKLAETIDQLLGYSAWRDTKTAVILFNRNKNFSNVLATIPETVRAHPNYKRALVQRGETDFRYVFAHKDDPNRELHLTVLVFDVPT